MAKIKLLIDTDIIIDFLKGIKTSKDLFRSNKFDFYCSIQSKKELLSKIGLKDSERKRIATVLSKIKVLKIDNDISGKFSLLVEKYGDDPELIADYVIAATAWAKKLPVLTRNRKHFERIKEVALSPGYALEEAE